MVCWVLPRHRLYGKEEIHSGRPPSTPRIKSLRRTRFCRQNEQRSSHSLVAKDRKTASFDANRIMGSWWKHRHHALWHAPTATTASREGHARPDSTRPSHPPPPPPPLPVCGRAVGADVATAPVPEETRGAAGARGRAAARRPPPRRRAAAARRGGAPPRPRPAARAPLPPAPRASRRGPPGGRRRRLPTWQPAPRRWPRAAAARGAPPCRRPPVVGVARAAAAGGAPPPWTRGGRRARRWWPPGGGALPLAGGVGGRARARPTVRAGGS